MSFFATAIAGQVVQKTMDTAEISHNTFFTAHSFSRSHDLVQFKPSNSGKL
jgi:hypothetical protein